MKELIRRCFDCVHIQPQRSGEHFATICDKTGKPTDPSAVCDDFKRQAAIKRKSPHAAKHKAIGDKPEYTIKSRTLRKAFRGVPSFSLTPRSKEEETIAAGLLDRLTHIVNDFARQTAKRAINKIGRN